MMPMQPFPPLDNTYLLNNFYARLEPATLTEADRAYCARLALLACDFGAQWATKLAQLVPLGPQDVGPNTAAITGAFVAALTALANEDAQAARQHRALLAALPGAAGVTLDAAGLPDYDHYAWPLPSLMRELPADITNAGALNADERGMCVAVVALADKANIVVLDGLQALGELLALAGPQLRGEMLCNAGRLLAYLAEHARFLTFSAAEYGAAAAHLQASRLRR